MLLNGVNVEGRSSSAEVSIRGKVVKVTLTHIGADEQADCQFEWHTAPEGYRVSSKKVGNRIATTIAKGEVVLFDCLSADSAFVVLGAAFGWSRSKSNGVYTSSNPTRKEFQRKQETKVQVAVVEGGVL